MESMESRLLLSGTMPLTVSEVAVFDGTQLLITGTTGADDISISQSPSGILVSDGALGSQTFGGTFSSIKIVGNGGNDVIGVDSSVTVNCLIYGGAGNDLIEDGGSGNDEIWGGGGSDTIQAGSGNDTLVSIGDSAAMLVGGSGFDSFWMDATSTEQAQNVTAAEQAGGNLHQISAFLETGANLGPTIYTFEGTTYTIYVPPTGTAPAANPAASGTYQYLTGDPLFSDAGPAANDLYQGIVDDCYFMAALSATAATDPNHIRQSICDLGDGTYAVEFTNGSGIAEYVRVTGDLPVSGGSLPYARLGAQNSLWAALMEKAYAVVHTGADTYASLSGGEPGAAFENLGAISIWGLQSVTSAQQLLAQMNSDLTAGAGVTYTMGGHVYTVDSVNLTTNQVFLRNPYGSYTTLTGAQAYANFQGEAAANMQAQTIPVVSSFQVNDGNPQRSMIDSLTVTFNEPVTLASGAIALNLLSQTGGPPTPMSFALNSADGGKTWVLTFTDPSYIGRSLPDGAYELIVSAGGVTGSGNVNMAGDQDFEFFRLYGDVDGNGTVNSVDSGVLAALFGHSTNSSDWYLDYDGDGQIGSNDFGAFAANFGHRMSIPTMSAGTVLLLDASVASPAQVETATASPIETTSTPAVVSPSASAPLVNSSNDYKHLKVIRRSHFP
jgi:Calpain family cysteine protease/RTX calcium-binding nonapeptide repeat (4 copies)